MAEQSMFSPFDISGSRRQFQSSSPSSNSASSFAIPSTPEQDKDATARTMSKKPLDISNLMSPPELPLFDHFNQGGVAATPMGITMAAKPSIPEAPLSPPISPHSKGSNSVDRVSSSSSSITVAPQDPILYPHVDVSPSPPRPLFGISQSVNKTQRTVDEHVAARPAALFRAASPPPREDYVLTLYFKSEVMKRYSENPSDWLRQERSLLEADRRAASAIKQQLHRVLAAKPVTSRPAAPRVTKPEKPRRPARLAPPKLAPQSVATPRHSSTNRIPSATPEPRSRTVAPNREDKDFKSRSDYCPPLELPNKPNSLKVDWKGNPLDLSKDPFQHLLHPDELLLAAGLRLDCATYLTSKRRIFERRLECAFTGKEFRKTDAQQACKIDVNKASKLWTAYDKVGWLDIRHMRKFMGSKAN